MKWLHRRNLEAGIVRQGFPARRNGFPAPDHRESAAAAAETLVISGAGFSAGDIYRRTSLHFPYRSGNRPQRRVRPRLHPPPFGLVVRRLWPHTRYRVEKRPRFRGALAMREPAIRTGDHGFGPQVRFPAGKPNARRDITSVYRHESLVLPRARALS